MTVIELETQELDQELVLDTEADVALAALWMDAEFPGWADRIDQERLLIHVPCICIIGQTTGNEHAWGDLRRAGRLGEYRRGLRYIGSNPFANPETKPYWLAEINKRVND